MESYDEMRARAEAAEQKQADLEAEVKRMDARLDDMRSEQADLSAERDELTAELETLRGEHAEACGTVARLTQERDQAQVDASMMRRLLAEATGEAKGLREALRLVIAGQA